MAFVPSEHSYGAGESTTQATASSGGEDSWLSKITGAVTGGVSGIEAWATVIDAISDPRVRVATLKAKIKNYKRMRAKYGFGPIADLYTNQIQLMQARLQAEKKNLGLEKEGETSTWGWRVGGWFVLGTVGLYFGAKAIRALRRV